MERIFEYAIVRLVPETFRGEQINIGIVVFKDTGTDVRIYSQPSLMKALGVNAASLEWIPGFIRDQDNADRDIHERWENLSKFPGFSLSERGWIAAENDEQYELRLSRVRSDYVDRPRPIKSKSRNSSLVRELRGIFKDYRIMGSNPSDVHKHKVVSNTPVGPSGKLHVDFLVKNGVFHATETADFRGASDAGVAELKEAALASFTLQYARQQLGLHDTKCYLVYAASSIIESAVSPALQLVEPSVDRIFNLESDRDRHDYLDVMLAAAGSPRFNSSH